MGNTIVNNRIVFSPTESASILIVPGPKKTGAYIGRLVTPRGNYDTEFRGHLGHVKAELAALLEKHGYPYILVNKLNPRLIYSSHWDQDALKKQPGYNQKDADDHTAFVSKLSGTLDAAKDYLNITASKIPPITQGLQYGQSITSNDVRNGTLKHVISEYGDFWVVIKWGLRNRQRIKASELVKNYKRIVAVGKDQNDWIREIFLERDPNSSVDRPHMVNRNQSENFRTWVMDVDW